MYISLLIYIVHPFEVSLTQDGIYNMKYSGYLIRNRNEKKNLTFDKLWFNALSA